MATPTPSNAAYQYDDLGQGNVIRLVKLEPASSAYLLSTFEIGTLPNFYALSYCWGPDGRSEHILCNGRALRVTPTLKQCLGQLYAVPELCTWFWVDQICIDQDNLDEKSHQVRMMPRIYQNAIRTVVWIAPSLDAHVSASVNQTNPPCDGYDERLFSFAKFVFLHTESSEDLSYLPNSQAQYQLESDGDPDCQFWTGRLPRSRALGMPDDLLLWNLGSASDPYWQKIISIFDAPWFHRIWAIQEVFFSRRVPYLLYNGRRRNFLHLLWAGAFVAQNITVFDRGNHRPGELVHQAHLRATRHARLLLQLAVAKSAWTLESLVWRTAHYKASDPRDKFFVLLSLAGDFVQSPTPWELMPHYARPPAQVARDATRYLIETSDNLLLLSLINRDTRDLLDYPSPGFGEQQYVLKGAPYTIERKGYRAASHLPVRANFRGDLDVLTLAGRRFDPIVEVGQHDDNDDVPRLVRWCRRGYDRVQTMWKPMREQFLAIFSATLATRYDVQAADARPSVSDFLAWLMLWPGGAPGRHLLLDFVTAGVPHESDSGATALPASECIPADGNPRVVDRWIAMYEAGGIFQYRQFGVTAGGDVLVGPRAIRPGDVVCLLDGGQLPVVLRPFEPRSAGTTPREQRESSRWLFVGECYVNKFNQDTRSHVPTGSLLAEWFDLV